MDNTGKSRSSFSLGRVLANFLTIIIFLATLGVGAALAAVFINPQLSINPFPPPTLPPLMELPTSTVTPEPTSTPDWTITPTVPSTATETATPIPPTETATPELPTETPTPTQAPFSLQAGSVAATTSWFYGCNWMGVGGHVLDSDNTPLTGYGIQLGGTLDDVPKNMETISGSASDLLGTSGYLFDLADHPIASEGTLWMQMVDVDTGDPLSERIYLTTYDICSKNLLLVNWLKSP
jgi:hypothetical protein